MPRNNGRLAREYRRKGAKQRDEDRAQRTPQQQLALLDERLGKGIGAKKERARLQRLIDAPAKKPKKKRERKTANK